MALQSKNVLTIKSFNKAIQDIMLRVNKEAVRGVAEEVAQELLSKCAVVSVPTDTGALARSAGTKWNGNKLMFGFGMEYASIQNYGGARLPLKFYGSELGPNLYFSKTLDLNLAWTFKRIGEKLKARLAGPGPTGAKL